MSPDEHEKRIQEVLLIMRHRNFMLYGIHDVDESYVRGLRDSMLDYVIERDRELRERDF